MKEVILLIIAAIFATIYNVIEPIEVIESWDLNFSLGNAIKYILRSPYKGKQIEDLEKARWYIDREINRLKDKEAHRKEEEWSDDDIVEYI